MKYKPAKSIAQHKGIVAREDRSRLNCGTVIIHNDNPADAIPLNT